LLKFLFFSPASTWQEKPLASKVSLGYAAVN